MLKVVLGFEYVYRILGASFYPEYENFGRQLLSRRTWMWNAGAYLSVSACLSFFCAWKCVACVIAKCSALPLGVEDLVLLNKSPGLLLWVCVLILRLNLPTQQLTNPVECVCVPGVCIWRPVHCQGALVSTAHHSGCAGQVGQAFCHPPHPHTPIQWLCWPGWSGFFFSPPPPPPPHHSGCASQVGQAFFCPADPPLSPPHPHTVVVPARLVRLFSAPPTSPPHPHTVVVPARLVMLFFSPAPPPTSPLPSQWLCQPGWSSFFLPRPLA